jgi:hypothetical protein
LELRQVIVFHAFPNERRWHQAQIVSAVIALRDGLRLTWQTLARESGVRSDLIDALRDQKLLPPVSELEAAVSVMSASGARQPTRRPKSSMQSARLPVRGWR